MTTVRYNESNVNVLKGGGREREREKGRGRGGSNDFRNHNLTQVLPFVTHAQEIPECTDRCESYSNQNVLPFC